MLSGLVCGAVPSVELQACMCAAGQKFQAIAQQDIKNTSALHNWAKSICIRASLKDNPEVSSWLAAETGTGCAAML